MRDRDFLLELAACVVIVLILGLALWGTLSAEHRCKKSGGVYVRTFGYHCLHRKDVPR